VKDDKKDPLGKALGIPPLESPASSTAVQTIIDSAHDDSARNDFERARSNVYEVMERASDGVEILGQIAEQSQHPRAFEVLANLLKTQLEASRELMTLQKDIRDIRNIDERSDGGGVTNNLFVGSTHELQQMIAAAKEKDK